jgi:hypothetical protein
VNDDEEYVTGVLDCSFDELLNAPRLNGADVEQGIIVDGEFISQAND